MRIVVYGKAIQQGSKRAIPGRGGGRPMIVEDSKHTRPWRAVVKDAARQEVGEDWQPLLGPITVDIMIHTGRPKWHYRTGAHAHELKPNAPHWVPVKPDIDKLGRLILDALTDAGVWRDDCQIASLTVAKVYVSHEVAIPQTRIDVNPLEDGHPRA